MSSGRCWVGSSESRSLIHRSSSSVYGGRVGAGAAAAGGACTAGAGVLDGADIVTYCISVAETVSDATKCYEWVWVEGSPFGQH